MDRGVLALGLCILLAGCLGAGMSDANTSNTTPTITAAPTETQTQTQTPEQTTTPTETEEFDPGPNNAWDADPIKVAIYRDDNPDRDFEPLLRETLEFWQAESEAGRVGYDLNYTIVNDTSEAHILVGFVNEIPSCGDSSEDIAGCAHHINHGESAPSPTVAEVAIGYNDSATVQVLKHEIGHTLGYGHNDDDIYGFMNDATLLGQLDQPNIDERDYFWEVNELLVYVNYSASTRHGDGAHDRRVNRVIDNYNDGGELPDGVELIRTENESEAHIHINFEDSVDSEHQNIAYYTFVDLDYDGEPNYYVRYDIYIGDINNENVEDVVGYHMGFALYAQERSELPREYR